MFFLNTVMKRRISKQALQGDDFNCLESLSGLRIHLKYIITINPINRKGTINNNHQKLFRSGKHSFGETVELKTSFFPGLSAT